jgi:hypothetical protein
MGSQARQIVWKKEFSLFMSYVHLAPGIFRKTEGPSALLPSLALT